MHAQSARDNICGTRTPAPQVLRHVPRNPFLPGFKVPESICAGTHYAASPNRGVVSGRSLLSYKNLPAMARYRKSRLRSLGFQNCRKCRKSLGSGPPVGRAEFSFRPIYPVPGYSSMGSIRTGTAGGISYFRGHPVPTLRISVTHRAPAMPSAQSLRLQLSSRSRITAGSDQELGGLHWDQKVDFWKFACSPIQTKRVESHTKNTYFGFSPTLPLPSCVA